ncbi:MAG: tRNA methyltransferase, has a role in tRNA modification [Phylliscum demangeonii]|nr:MAG: tRNA methyltransferase, has a role in tRNA modification [Phylliscum demangeonii]
MSAPPRAAAATTTAARPPSPTSSTRFEDAHVHQVYERIAAPFARTRHKAWPLVTRFLQQRAPGSVGLDVGCGNGKYFGVVKGGAAAAVLLACDRSARLASLAAAASAAAAAAAAAANDVALADILHLPFAGHRFAFVIAIAVVHHLSTRARRVQALRELLALLVPRVGGVVRRPGAAGDGHGQALVLVWALEQRGSRRGWEAGGPQDVLVPWVLRRGKEREGVVEGRGVVEGEGLEGQEEVTLQRYYHLYCCGELDDEIRAAGGVVEESGWERDNWWAVMSVVGKGGVAGDGDGDGDGDGGRGEGEKEEKKEKEDEEEKEAEEETENEKDGIER